MALQPGNPIVGGIVLRIPAIQSPNFVTGVSGWHVDINGSAEFNNLTIRGTFKGTNFEINANGIFQYSGVPALGNLIGSDANNGGTDPHGNAYVAGKAVYLNDGVSNFIALQMTTASPSGIPRGQIGVQTATSAAGPYSQAQVMQFTGTLLELTAQTVSVDGSLSATGGTQASPTLITTDVKHYVGGTNSLGTTFGVAWANLGGTSAKLAFWLTPENEVAIQGVISTTGTAPNNNVFTLPAGYRPANDQRFPHATSAAPAAACLVQVSTAGVVQVSGAPGGVATTVGVDVRVSLDL